MKKKVLFLCVANSARSQIAEGITKAQFGELFEVHSAGSKPSGVVNPLAIKVLAEIGIDISQYRSKSIEELPGSWVSEIDYVITLCAEEVCPVLLTRAKKMHWPIKDPQNLNDFREVREIIREKMREFVQEVH